VTGSNYMPGVPHSKPDVENIPLNGRNFVYYREPCSAQRRKQHSDDTKKRAARVT